MRSTAERPAQDHRARTRRRRLVLVVACVVLGIPALLGGYYVVGNWYLRERLPGVLNVQPELFLADWHDARTTWPGKLHAHGIRFRKQNAFIQWELRLDQADVRIGLIPLLFHRLSVNGLTGQGMSLRMRFVPGHTPGAEAGSPNAPPIEGFPEPPIPVPTSPLPPSAQQGQWKYIFDDVDVADVREVWVGPFRYAGSAHARTSMAFRPGEDIAVSAFRFETPGGDVFVGKDVLASEVIGRLGVTVDHFDMKDRPALDVLEKLGVNADVKGRLHDVQLPRASFPKIPWLGFGGGMSAADLSIRIRNGAFVDGTAMHLASDDFTVAYPGYEVHGAASIVGSVDATRGVVTAKFSDFTIRKEGSPTAHVRGQGFSAELRTKDLTLRHPLETFEVELQLPDSEVVDFNAYDSTIPAPLRVHVTSGTGRIRGNLLITQDGGRGSVDLTGKDVTFQRESAELRTDLALAVKIPALDFKAGTYDFSGTTLDTTNGMQVNGGSDRFDGWWSKIQVTACRLTRDPSVLASVVADGSFRDTRPLVAIVAADRPLIKLIKPVLVAPDASLHARFTAGPALVDLDELTLTGKKLDLRACLDMRNDAARGVFFVDGGLLSAGVTFGPTGRNIKPLAKPEWFVEHSPYCDDPSHLPPD